MSFVSIEKESLNAIMIRNEDHNPYGEMYNFRVYEIGDVQMTLKELVDYTGFSEGIIKGWLKAVPYKEFYLIGVDKNWAIKLSDVFNGAKNVFEVSDYSGIEDVFELYYRE